MIIEIEGVGPVLFEKSKRARNLNISVRISKPVRVCVPLRISFDKAKEAVKSKIGWIIKHLARANHLRSIYNSKLIDVSHLSHIQRKEKLIDRAKELAAERGFNYGKISIRNQRTRWGSCSARNNISLNIKLIQLPDRLIDYIILHELIHTRIKNHGQDFKRELNRLVGNRQALNLEIKRYHISLME
ncbi:M48 family metallopeptidase [Candidatus Omnitrophota bacterium]